MIMRLRMEKAVLEENAVRWWWLRKNPFPPLLCRYP
jgi:hypothetical protein